MVEVIGKVKLELSFIWPKNTTVLCPIVFFETLVIQVTLVSICVWLLTGHINLRAGGDLPLVAE